MSPPGEAERDRRDRPRAHRSAGIDTPVVVVGAGPYGLSAASYLADAGVAFRQFGVPMGGWSDHMPKGMYLKSTAADSSIGTPRRGFGIADYCREAGIRPYDADGGERPIPIEEFIAYGRWFQEALLPEVEPARVCAIAPSGRDYAVTLSSGEELRTSAVIVSCGAAPFARFPAALEGDEGQALRASGAILHSADCTDFSSFAGQRVAVVGAGQSALESAVLLREAGAAVHLVVRGRQLVWGPQPRLGQRSALQRLAYPPAPLGAGWPHLLLTRYARYYRHLPDRTRLALVRQILGPSGAWWLRPRFDESIDVRLEREVAAVRADAGALEVGLRRPGSPQGGASDSLRVDRIVAATGYRVDVSALEFVDATLRGAISTLGGSPRLSSGFESSVPGLFFTGLNSAASFGPMLRFVAGSDFAGRTVARGVSRRLASR